MKTNLDWNKFKLFYYIAKAGSFKATAENLNMSQSSLSRTIQDLEYQLGSKLFERVYRGIALTKQGQYLLEAVEKSFEELTKAETLIKEEEDEIKGVLKVCLPHTLPPGWFISHIKDFLSDNPQLQLYISTDEGRENIKLIKFDASLSFDFETPLESVCDLIHVFHLKIFASQEYINKHGMPKGEKDLYSHKLITCCLDTPPPFPQINWLVKLGVSEGVKRTPYMCINLLSEMIQACEEGYGIISLPLEYIEKRNSPLIEILPKTEKPRIPLYIAYPQYLKDTQKIKALVNYLKNKLTLQNNSYRLNEMTITQKSLSHKMDFKRKN
jgi:DNA-binding transcriptional LysR family regulator